MGYSGKSTQRSTRDRAFAAMRGRTVVQGGNGVGERRCGVDVLLERVLPRLLHPVRKAYREGGEHVVRIQPGNKALVARFEQGLGEKRGNLPANPGKVFKRRDLGDPEGGVHVGKRRIQRRALDHFAKSGSQLLCLCQDQRAAAAGDDVFRSEGDKAEIRGGAAWLLREHSAQALTCVFQDGNAVGAQRLDVRDHSQRVVDQDGPGAFLHEEPDLPGVQGAGFRFHVRDEGNEALVRQHAKPEGRRQRRQDHGVLGREPQRVEGHGQRQVRIAQGDAAGVPQELAGAGDQLARDLPGTELVGDDAGQDAPHVLSLHGGTKDW